VIIVDNDGYTIERAIHGPQEPYNNIAPWDWGTLLSALAPGETTITAHRARTAGELARVLEQTRTSDGVSVIQAILPRMDVPDLLAAIAREASRANQRPAETTHE
jgi:TPP-dependent 2-oxoacid decarboxylase